MNKIRSSIILTGLLLVACVCHASSLTEAQINKLKPSVVRIKVNGKSGTGFIYSEGKYAVTAFHVISGSNGIVTVEYPSLGIQTYTGHVVRTLKEADLALIQIDGYRNVPALHTSPSSPAFNTTFTTIGFLWDAPSTFPKDITKRETKVLNDFIPSATRNDIQAAQCPSLQLSVYSFEGNPLVPGYSGAPIFNSDEGIIGISDGGIKEGIASVSWGIPAGQLNKLMISTEYAQGSTIVSQSLFSADVVENPHYASEFVTIQSKNFYKVRTEFLLNILSSSDDVLGLNQLLASFPPQIDRNIKFDVYQNFESGAMFIAPEGFAIRKFPDRIEVVAPDMGSVLTIKCVQMPENDQMAVQNVSTQMELSALNPLLIPGYFWNIDNAFTYINPLFRPDGLVARRKAFYQIRLGTQFTQPEPGMYVFESFVYKRDLMFQLYTINTNCNPPYIMQRISCQSDNFQGQGCPIILDQLRNWMALIAATHFATFSLDRA